MPPSRNSRYINSLGMQDTDGRWFLSLPTPVRYRDMPTNRTRTCEGGETWWGLAEEFYGAGMGIKYWWHLMNYQPEPAVDPTIVLAPGATVVWPPLVELDAMIATLQRAGG